MHEKLFELSEDTDLAIFYGVNNVNIRLISDLFPLIKVSARGHIVKVAGSDDEADKLLKKLHDLEIFCIENNSLSREEIIQILKGEAPLSPTSQNLILHGIGGKQIVARTKNQQRLVAEFAANDLLFAVGPAGSGKTYTSIALAVKALKNREVRRIILSRPAVEAGEKLGFLPGDMKDKIDPYLQPLYDALQDMIMPQKLKDYLENDIIQIAPLAFMRGRTLGDAAVILDEAQNTTVQQIKMFLTRMGTNAKMIVTGDLTQIDLPASQKSGLIDALNRLHNIKGIACIEFDKGDILRHKLVQKIVDAYEKNDISDKK
ncbi:MAG: PhoH family protein [Prevotellaceae bacterium]|jgi:phosphate starvation-inducible PhoH-like protein|nr:PhoH family protein [Prevotellaceae bacterium]